MFFTDMGHISTNRLRKDWVSLVQTTLGTTAKIIYYYGVDPDLQFFPPLTVSFQGAHSDKLPDCWALAH